MSSSGLSFPSHVDTPLLRGDVTRLVSLGDPSPLEDRGRGDVGRREAGDRQRADGEQGQE